jgi:hypothetical protein
MMHKTLLLFTAVGLAALPAPAFADFSYSDFQDTSQLKLNGNAATVGSGANTVLRVTPAASGQSGSVFSLSPIALTDNYSFSTRFTFNFNNQGGIEGADGLVFVVQTNSNSVGGAGGGIGYANLPNSLGIEFDSYQNTDIGDINNNHVGVDLSGNITSAAQIASPFLLDSGTNLTAWIDYNSTTQLLEIFLNNANSRPVNPLLTYNVNLQSVLGGSNQAFVGFTSGTGAGWANHDVLNWDFVSRFAPINSGVPEPATWAMMLLGFGAIGFQARRARKASRSVQPG